MYGIAGKGLPLLGPSAPRRHRRCGGRPVHLEQDCNGAQSDALNQAHHRRRAPTRGTRRRTGRAASRSRSARRREARRATRLGAVQQSRLAGSPLPCQETASHPPLGRPTRRPFRMATMCSYTRPTGLGLRLARDRCGPRQPPFILGCHVGHLVVFLGNLQKSPSGQSVGCALRGCAQLDGSVRPVFGTVNTHVILHSPFRREHGAL